MDRAVPRRHNLARDEVQAMFRVEMPSELVARVRSRLPITAAQGWRHSDRRDERPAGGLPARVCPTGRA
jgi:hypothetical protein